MELHSQADQKGLRCSDSRGIALPGLEGRSFAPPGRRRRSFAPLYAMEAAIPDVPRRSIEGSPRPLPGVKIIRDADFARRLNMACDGHPYVPALNHGRLTYIKNELESRFDEKVSVETVRKWFAGEARPRPDKMQHLANLLDADVSWLSLGVQTDMSPREQKVRDATADGAVNLVAGLVAMNGGSPAFPKADDARARAAHIDLYAIIKGAQYAFHVSLASELRQGGYSFMVPVNHGDAFQIGVIQDEDLEIRLIEISEDLVETKGQRRGGAVEVTVPADDVDDHRITTFRKRL